MQPANQQTSHTWLEIALYALAVFFGGGGIATVLTLWLAKKKLPSEIGLSVAQTRRTEAETHHIVLTDDLSAAEMMMDALRELNKAQRTIVQMSAKADMADKYRLERDLLQNQLDTYISVEQQLKNGTSGEHQK